MPGRPITDRQVARYMELRDDGKPQVQAAAASGFSERSGRTLERHGRPAAGRQPRSWRTRADPFATVWTSEVEPLLAADPALRALTLFRELQRRHPGQFEDGQRRTLERRVHGWRRRHGPSPEIMFPQEHPPGWQALLDFTLCTELAVSVAGMALPHRLGHLRLPCSGFAYARVILGGESFPALAQTLVAGLRALGGAPETLRTDSLSAAFRNLGLKQVDDLTARHRQLCAYFAMRPTRNNPGVSHENGGVESPNGHLKDRLDQALRLRGSRDFADLEAYRAFVDGVIAEDNARRAPAIDAERAHLRALPDVEPVTWNEAAGVVSSFAMIRILGVGYTVPGRLRGCRLQARIFDERIELRWRGELVSTCSRLHDPARSRQVDYRHVIDALVRKPGAFARLVYRDDLHPRPAFRRAWEALRDQRSERDACRAYMRILHLAHSRACEGALALELQAALDAGALPDVEALVRRFGAPPPADLPTLDITQPDPGSYDRLLAGAWAAQQDTA